MVNSSTADRVQEELSPGGTEAQTVKWALSLLCAAFGPFVWIGWSAHVMAVGDDMGLALYQALAFVTCPFGALVGAALPWLAGLVWDVASRAHRGARNWHVSQGVRCLAYILMCLLAAACFVWRTRP